MQAIILAGGLGTRLYPLTLEFAKPMIPLHGKPILEHCIELLRKYDFNEIYFALHYKPDQIKDYFKDGMKFGIKTYYFVEKEPLGTAGAMTSFKGKIIDDFLVCNADELKDFDLKDMLAFHKKHNAMITIALTHVDDPTIYGVVDMENDRIKQFVEKPESISVAPSNYINSGLYIFSPDIFRYIKEGFSMLEKDVFPQLAVKGKVFGYKLKGQWFDTGTWDRYEIAHKNWNGVTR